MKERMRSHFCMVAIVVARRRRQVERGEGEQLHSVASGGEANKVFGVKLEKPLRAPNGFFADEKD